jgi:transposase
VETRNHDLVTIKTTGSVNADTVFELIRELDKRYPGEEMTLTMDNTRYQYNAKKRDFAKGLKVKLLYLSAYSPNLNLIERVWKMVKSKCLRNRYYDDFASFCSAIDGILGSLSGKNSNLLRSLVTEMSSNLQFRNPDAA